MARTRKNRGKKSKRFRALSHKAARNYQKEKRRLKKPPPLNEEIFDEIV